MLPKSSRLLSMDRIGRGSNSSARITGSDLDVVETCWTGPMAGPDHLLRLAFTAVRHTPQHPMIAVGDGGTGIPELGGDTAVGWVLQHARAFAVANLPSDLATELEVVTLVVNGPATVGLHVNSVVHPAQYFVQGMLARHETHVIHQDERQTGPSGGAHGTVRTRLSDRGRSFARGHVADEPAVANDVDALRGNTFVVEEKRAEAGTMLRPRVAYRIDDLGAVAEIVQLVER